MQFKNPEILYFLVLLLIPIIVHLFQLQKFVKVPFTNVAFLKQLAQKNRKSSQIKKWLILATRLLLLSTIIFAFAQPYFSSQEFDKKPQNFIYLDNSLSLNTKGEKGNLLQTAGQEILNYAPENEQYSLLTNTHFFDNISKETLKNEILKTKPTYKNLSLKAVLLKINSLKKSHKNRAFKSILISDFQKHSITGNFSYNDDVTLIKLIQSNRNNVAIDSVYVDNKNAETTKIYVVLNNQGSAKENIPIALYNDKKLISKRSFSVDENHKKTISFSINNSFTTFLGRLEVSYNDAFNFDNSFYFTLNKSKKINVIAIGKSADFLSKIYTKDEFNFKQSSLKNVNYNSLENQQLIILNEVSEIPNSLANSLAQFSENGGDLVIIPSKKQALKSFNVFLKKVNAGIVITKMITLLKITNINYNHPVLTNAFTKKVLNFQYPSVESYYSSSFKKEQILLSFENNIPFVKQVKLKNSNLYWIASSLDKSNSNFTNSPLIVPLFYNFASANLQHSKLFYTLGKQQLIDVPVQLKRDEFLTISRQKNAFIPLQQSFQNKVRITLNDNPKHTGFFSVISNNTLVENLAFNYPKEESSLNYLAIEKLKKSNQNIEISDAIATTFKEIYKKNEVYWLWKWFLALAIVSLLLEIFILKFFKV